MVVLRLGLVLVQRLFAILSRKLVQEAKDEGFTVERRPVVTFNTVLGPVEVESPYLYRRESGEGRRPMRHVFGVVGRRYSDALERALTDFGIEKSFGRASTQFAEHYGWEVGRTTILRLTENLGAQADDGAQGRKEAMELSFADIQIILDPSHLKSHFYETAASLGMEGPAAHAWVGAHFEKLAEGHAQGVLADLETESGELHEE